MARCRVMSHGGFSFLVVVQEVATTSLGHAVLGGVCARTHHTDKQTCKAIWTVRFVLAMTQMAISSMPLVHFLLLLFSTVAVVSSLSMSTDNNNKVPRIDERQTVASTKWLRLETWHYTDAEGVARQWDVATRTTKKKKSNVDAVVIIPLLKKKASTKVETLLVEQYRPPVNSVTVEFPAGLVDNDESAENAALRELREETGYVGEKCTVVPQVSMPTCMSPGITDETTVIVVVEVDLDNPYNFGTPQATPDDGELLTIKRVELKKGLLQILKQGSAMPIQGLYLFIMGMEMGMDLANSKKKGEEDSKRTTK